MRKCHNLVFHLIRLIHFNKDHPENMNIKQRNKKKPMVDIYNGKEWYHG